MKKEKTSVPSQKQTYNSESLQQIEDARSTFWSSYKRHNTLKLIVMMICLTAIIVAFIVLPQVIKGNQGLQSGLTIVIALLALGGTYGYSVFVRRKFDKKMKEYFQLYYNCVNKYVFDTEGFSNVELQEPGKITLEEFNECKLYKDVIEAGSRGLTKFSYKDIEMSIVDCAGNVKAEKRVVPVFVGKMVRAKASYKGELPVIVYLKGNDRSLPPTNVEGIKKVSEDEKMVIYSEYKDVNKVLNSHVMKAINNITLNKVLVDLAITIYGEKVFVMMGYDDPLMVLPLQSEFNQKPTELFKGDIEAVAKLIEELNK